MADGDDDVIFERDDMVAIARGGPKESKLTCNKLVITAMLCGAFFGLGMCLAIPGPTLIDLEENTDSSVAQISMIFTSRSGGYLLGSIIGGVLFERLNQPCLLSVAMIVTSVATAVAPWCKQFILLATMIMFQGVSMGVLDTGGNLICLETWGRDNGPHMQALHFSFGFGACLAPLLAAPFLHGDHTDDAVNISHSNTTITFEGTSPVKYSYLIIAIFVSFVSLGFMILCCCRRKSGSSKTMDSLKSEYSIREDKLVFRIQMLVLLFIFYFLYVGAEVTYGSLVSRFAVEVFKWNRKKAAVIASVFWGSFAAGRLLAVFLAHCLNPTTMLIADLVVSTLSVVGLAFVENETIISSYMSGEALFWILTSTLGGGMASIFPTGITWIERYMKVTGKAAAIFVVGSALGEMVIPLFTAFLYEKNPMNLIYVLIVAAFLSIVIFVVMVNLACSMGERYGKVANVDEDMQPLRLLEDDTPTDDLPNGHDGADRKKRVTFVLNSDTAQSSSSKESVSKGSILRLKSVQKKD